MKLGLLWFLWGSLLAQDGGVVEGTVVDKATGAGIGGATVTLFAIPSIRYEATTDAAGVFRLTGVKPGSYQPQVAKTGYYADEAMFFGRPVVVREGAGPVRLQYGLTAPSKLSGRVIGIDGKPAAKVEVTLNPNITVEGVRTDEEGAFLFEDVRPGTYTIVARPTGSLAALVKDGVRMEIVPTYFPSAVDAAVAQPVVVLGGLEQGGFDIRLQTAPVYRVRGVALLENGRPAAKAVVNLKARVAGANQGGFAFTGGSGPTVFSMRGRMVTNRGAPEEPVVAGEDGVFEFRSVQSGEYTIGVASDVIRYDEPGPGNREYLGSTQISVGRRDLEDVRIQVARPFDWYGTVEVSGDSQESRAAPANVGVFVQMIVEEGLQTRAGGREKDGRIKIADVTPGRYRIQTGGVTGGAGYYAADILMGDSSVLGHAVDVTEISPPLQVVLKPGGAVRGVIENAPGAAAVLMPQSLEGTGYTITADAQGNFEISGVAPGGYYAVALDRFSVLDMIDSSRLSSLIPQAASVSVEAGGSASIQLRLLNSFGHR